MNVVELVVEGGGPVVVPDGCDDAALLLLRGEALDQDVDARRNEEFARCCGIDRKPLGFSQSRAGVLDCAFNDVGRVNHGGAGLVGGVAEQVARAEIHHSPS